MTTDPTPAPHEQHAAPAEANSAAETKSPVSNAQAPSTTAAETDDGNSTGGETSGPRTRIKIGSQRDTVPRPVRTIGRPSASAVPPRAAPNATGDTAAPPEASPVSVPTPPAVEIASAPPVPIPPQAESPLPKTEFAPTAPPEPPPVPHTPASIPELDAELDEEVAAAMAGMSLDRMIADDDAAGVGADIEPDTRRQATVVKVHGDDVFFSLNARHEGVASARQFKEPPQPGTSLEVVVTRFNAEDGLYDLNIPGASIDVSDWSDVTEGAVVDARITGANTGGLECMVNNLRGFIPASQVALYRIEDFAEYVGQKLPCVVTEINPQRRNLVLSHRAVLEREKEASKQSFLAQLEVGQIREGIVRNIRDFGAFVDLGGADGLIHVSKLSWQHVKHPSEVLQEGQQVQVKIDKIDPQTGKIGLSYRDLQDHPWTNIEEKLFVSSIVRGTVSRIAKFGAFVRLDSGIEGLIHISELAHHRVGQVSSVVSEGQEVEVKVLSIDSEAQRIALSLKATQMSQPAEQTESEEDEPPRELAVPKRHKPLKGGTDRAAGGDQFGLKW